MTPGASTPSPDAPDVQEALRCVSAALWKAFVAAELGSGTAAESPPGAEKEAAEAPLSTAEPLTSTTTTTAQRSDLEDGRGR
jgi:hypothetical protein